MDRKPITLYLLVILLTLQSVTALICGAAMMWEPSGVSMQLPGYVLDKAPFSNFFMPGFFLFTCLGLLPLLAAYGLWTRKEGLFRHCNIYHNYRPGWMLALFSGFGTLIWMTAQLYFTQTYHVLQTVYAAVGMLILILTLMPATMRYCHYEKADAEAGRPPYAAHRNRHRQPYSISDVQDIQK